MSRRQNIGGGRARDVQAILPDLVEATGANDWVESRPSLKRRDCRIRFLRSETFRLPEVVLKTYRSGKAAENQAFLLFERNRSIHRGATGEHTVPEHLLFVHRANALVMEYVNAPLAGDLLIRRFHSPAERARIIRRAAVWLRWFHSLSDPAQETPDPDALRQKVERTRVKIQNKRPAAWDDDPFLRDCIDRAAGYAAGIRDTPLLHATVHGDYTPFNLFIDGRKTCGFDYTAARRMPVHQDICRFLLYLDIYRLRPATRAEVDSCGGRRNDYETFFSAYGEDAIPPRETWLALRFIEITRRLASLSLQRSKRKGHVLRFIENPQLRHKARHIARILG
ncbi:MAG: phosphotransferase [Akkermansiaceae bacterium]|nr:phosphotransferase [Akkermansiaceae bacterium]MCP5546598.1 phosphotransferase [Akkermansiaceae bacterium]